MIRFIARSQSQPNIDTETSHKKKFIHEGYYTYSAAPKLPTFGRDKRAVRTPEMARRRPLLLVAAVVLLCTAEWHLVQAYKKAS